MAAEVFISYASQNRDRILDLVERLRGAGVSVWIDQMGIEGAAMWSQQIVAAIRACKVLILAISKNSATIWAPNISRSTKSKTRFVKFRRSKKSSGRKRRRQVGWDGGNEISTRWRTSTSSANLRPNRPDTRRPPLGSPGPDFWKPGG